MASKRVVFVSVMVSLISACGDKSAPAPQAGVTKNVAPPFVMPRTESAAAPLAPTPAPAPASAPKPAPVTNPFATMPPPPAPPPTIPEHRNPFDPPTIPDQRNPFAGPATTPAPSTSLLRPIECPRDAYYVHHSYERTRLEKRTENGREYGQKIESLEGGSTNGLLYEGCMGESSDGKIVRTHRWKYYYENGSLQSHQEYDLGARTGTWKRWTGSGMPDLVAHYENDIPEGTLIKYWSDEWTKKVHKQIEAKFEGAKLVSLTIATDHSSTKWLELKRDGETVQVTLFDEYGKEKSAIEIAGKEVTFTKGDAADFIMATDNLAFAYFAGLKEIFPKWVGKERHGWVMQGSYGPDTYAPDDYGTSMRNLGWAIKRKLRPENKGDLDLSGTSEYFDYKAHPEHLVKAFVDYLPEEVLRYLEKAFPKEKSY